MVKMIACVVLATLFVTEIGARQINSQSHAARDKNMFATNEYWGKGGLGIVNEHLYVILNSDKNQLLNSGEKWAGLGMSAPEVVIYFEGKVLPLATPPDGFDLSRSVVISFERDRVRFFDFVKMSGGTIRGILRTKSSPQH